MKYTWPESISMLGTRCTRDTLSTKKKKKTFRTGIRALFLNVIGIQTYTTGILNVFYLTAYSFHVFARICTFFLTKRFVTKNNEVFPVKYNKRK